MSILLVTDLERIAKPVIDFLTKHGQINFAAYNKVNLPKSKMEHFYCFKYKKKTIDILISNIGMTNAAYYMGRLISLKHYDFIYNFGLASSFSKKLNIGDLVNVYEDHFGDIGVETQKGFMDFNDLEWQDVFIDDFFSKGSIVNKTIVESSLTDNLPSVSSVTASTLAGSNKSIRTLKEKYHPDIQTFEGAAIAYIATMENIPYLQIRAVERKAEPWKYSEKDREIAIKKITDFTNEFLSIY